jgi:hypothetical protein
VIALAIVLFTRCRRRPDARRAHAGFTRAPDRVRRRGGAPFSLFVFVLFGFALVPAALPHPDARALLYAVRRLTVVRLLPVWLALTGSASAATRLFVGWTGPRGIASVLYLALLV